MTPISTLPDRVYQLLHERFGYQDFRPGQAAIIDALLQGQNVLTVMPTGSGKSLCYQLPALLKEGCTLVISPLIALMKDQVDSLQAHGIPLPASPCPGRRTRHAPAPGALPPGPRHPV